MKRCNNCQKFGHYAKDCPTQDVNICGKCTGNHRTSDCDSLVQKCANCARNNMEDVNHQTTSYKCPSLIKQQALLKKKINGGNLNFSRESSNHPR